MKRQFVKFELLELWDSNLLRESFYELDGKTRKIIYIYLWYSSVDTVIISLIKFFFTLAPPNIIISQVVTSSVFIIILIFLRYIPNILFTLAVLLSPFANILMGLFGCFLIVRGQYLIDAFGSILNAIFALWVLKYILQLWKSALKKIY